MPNGRAAIAGLNEVVLVTVRCSTRRRWPRRRRCTGSGRPGDANSVSDDKVLAIAADGWIPRIKLRELDAVRTLDGCAAVSRLYCRVLSTVCRYAGLHRIAQCSTSHKTRLCLWRCLMVEKLWPLHIQPSESPWCWKLAADQVWPDEGHDD